MLRLPSNQPPKACLYQCYLKPVHISSITTVIKLFWLTCSALICQRYAHSRIILGINIHIISSTGGQIMQNVGSHFSHKKLPGLIWTLNEGSIKNRERKKESWLHELQNCSISYTAVNVNLIFSKPNHIDLLNFNILQCCKQNIHIVLQTIVQCLCSVSRRIFILFEGQTQLKFCRPLVPKCLSNVSSYIPVHSLRRTRGIKEVKNKSGHCIKF